MDVLFSLKDRVPCFSAAHPELRHCCLAYTYVTKKRYGTWSLRLGVLCSFRRLFKGFTDWKETLMENEEAINQEIPLVIGQATPLLGVEGILIVKSLFFHLFPPSFFSWEKER